MGTQSYGSALWTDRQTAERFFFGSFFIFLQLNDGCKNFYQQIVKIYTYTTKNTEFIYIKGRR